MMTDKKASLRRPLSQYVVLACISLLALLLRLYYVRTAVVIQPIRGDAVQYYSYAWNLIRHGVFSSALPGATTFVPDSFRDPGYPVFLTAFLGAAGSMDAFIQHVTDVQCVLSALTVWIFAILARRWINFVAAVATGILLGLWPHTITLAGYVVGETLLGFLVALALFLLDEAVRRPRLWLPLATGGCFALAGLTNAVMAPFAPLLTAALFWRDHERRRLWGLILVATLVPLVAWSLRSAALPVHQDSAGDRVKMNLVQGSWPEYHAAYFFSHASPEAARIMKSINAEYAALRTTPTIGLGLMGRRLSSEPGRYAMWYLSKPLELWGWEIGIGDGDLYVYPTFHSPLVVQPALAAIVGALYFLSPFILLLALVGASLALSAKTSVCLPMRFATALAIWVTLIYGVLQSDARYSTPFRGLELLLAIFAAQFTTGILRRKSTFTRRRVTSQCDA